MNWPLTALTWEIWRRRRVSAYIVLACLLASAVVNLLVVRRLHLTTDEVENFSPFFGILMTASFLFLMGIFNHTENSGKEWSGFPYRHFILPVATWRLVLLPMMLGVAAVELNYFAWLKLVWTHEQISMPEWFAVVLGVYVILYQATLWSLAAFRAARLVALACGGVSIFLVAGLPFLARVMLWTWVTESRLVAILAGVAAVAVAVAWTSVSRQRSGGGRRRGWIRPLVDEVSDALPRRTKDFSSPAAAQFWFEWRRAGWWLPVCTTFIVLVIFVPFTWFKRTDPQFANFTLIRILATPVVLAFILGKGFIKPEMGSMNLSVPSFMAARPLSEGDFIVNKMKVAAASTALGWVPVLLFLGLWLPLWAERTSVGEDFYTFRLICPRTWLPVLILAVLALMILTWRVMVAGLWAGMSGKGGWYYGVPAAQVTLIALVILAFGIWGPALDGFCAARPELAYQLRDRLASWILAALVISKYWTAAFSWQQITPGRTWQYLLAWTGATCGLLTLAVLAQPPFDTDRLIYVYLLAALWMVPIARFGIAPRCLALNRHR
jgi:hypothetical protein